ncbi:NAD-dependent epimerase/dehydratase family protein [Chitinasiproducens palmae]|nr:NAD-dependent epimerase/dehydratase family protein [Chitinasiproducens palmae]
MSGANGFVGRALAAALCGQGHCVAALTRRPVALPAGVTALPPVGDDFAGMTGGWPARATDCVVHLAARVHVMNERDREPLAAFRRTNVAGSVRLAEAAAAAGVRRFVYVSSVKAMGEHEPDSGAHPWRESDAPAPEDPYGISKWETEQALAECAQRLGMELVIVRPPLVYGPGVGANFRQLLRAVSEARRLPIGASDARRSMIFIDNLVDALLQCVVRPEAAGHTFNVSDGVDLSVPDLVRSLAMHLGRPPRLIAVPLPLLDLAGRLSGRRAQIQRLTTPLRIDIGKIRRVLGWEPPIAMRDALHATAEWYLTYGQRSEERR